MTKHILLLTLCFHLVSSNNGGSLITRQSNDTTHLDSISDYIDSMYNDLWNISKTIHDNPELGFKEVKAHDLLTSFMEEQDGWNVTRSLYNISTSFSAVFTGSGDGPVVSFNSEYGMSTSYGSSETSLMRYQMLYQISVTLADITSLQQWALPALLLQQK